MSAAAPTARIAQIAPATEAEGPGVRFAVWFQGCPLRCPGCCNPEFLPFTGGQEMTFAELVGRFDTVRDRVEGVTLLGGEPFAHAAAGTALAIAARERGLSVMVFTGYTLAQLRGRPEPDIAALLTATDLLVDGPYVHDQPDTSRRWVGSTNQEIHFLTDRYKADDPCWRARNTLEIRVDRDGVSVNGFPAVGKSGLWKGWTRAANR